MRCANFLGENVSEGYRGDEAGVGEESLRLPAVLTAVKEGQRKN